jgi:NADH:ubiquinone oxidoreductase subunit 6 (subunit J)
MHTLLFNLYASLALTAGMGVIISKNPIHSVIFLILVFCNATGLLLLFKIELLAIMFIIIYVGAIAVLFLFVVMMLNIKINQPITYTNKILNPNDTTHRINQNILQILIKIQSPIIISSLSFIIIMLIFSLFLNNDYIPWFQIEPNKIIEQMNLLWNNQISLQKSWIILTIPTTNIQSLGYLIYTYYCYYFIMASFILLIAMIGAIILTMYKRKHASKKQHIYQQIARNFETAISYTN